MSFVTGPVVMTNGVMMNIIRNPGYSIWANICLERHRHEDWGDICDEDKEMNDESVRIESEGGYTGSIMSSYENGDDKLWIITESDRSCTTLLLPEEY